MPSVVPGATSSPQARRPRHRREEGGGRECVSGVCVANMQFSFELVYLMDSGKGVQYRFLLLLTTIHIFY